MTMEPGTLWFTEITPLDDEEIAWLNLHARRGQAYEALPDMTVREADRLFSDLWSHNRGRCRTCKAREGRCDNTTCIRARVTNKWFLSMGGTVPEVQYAEGIDA